MCFNYCIKHGSCQEEPFTFLCLVNSQSTKLQNLPSNRLELCSVFCISSAKNILPLFSHHTSVFHKGRTSFARRADAEKRCDAVDACGALGAGRRGAVIDVLGAVGPTPAVNTHADVAADQVGAGPSILASVWLQAALVHVFGTVLACRDERKRVTTQHLAISVKLQLCGAPT